MDIPIHPLRLPAFRAYWISRLLSTLAVSAMSIIIGWQVYGIARETMDIRSAAFLLGMIGAAQFVPLLVLTPVVGLVADSVDRRWIIRAATAVMMLTTAALGLLNALGLISLGALFSAAVVTGVIRAFAGPAHSALAPNLVPRESLPTAIAISSIAWQVGTIVGPSLGGLLYAVRSDLAYGTSTALLFVALALTLLIPPVPQPPAEPDRHPLTRIIDGFTYVRRNRLVLATITLDLFAVLLAGATALLPVFARDLLKVGAQGLGLLAAGMGIGAAATAVWFSIRPMKSNVGVKMLFAVVVFGLGILVFGTAHLVLPLGPAFWLALSGLVIAGSADMVSVYVRSSLIQLHTPDAMRGRVSAVSQLTISASNELGEFESGFLASLLGPVGAVVFGGIGAIVITLAWAKLFPELRLAKTFDPPETDTISSLRSPGVAQP